MPEAVLFRDLLCPTCGYDLRGSPSLRCPECGTQSSQATWSSRIPWVHRKTRGPLRAYIATLLMLLFHAPSLGHETRGRVARLPARRFHRISIALAVMIGALLIIAYALLIGSPNLSSLIGGDPDEWLAWPLFATYDVWLRLIAVPLGVWITAQAVMWLYRSLLPLFAGRRTSRRRIARLAYYASGLLPLQMLLIGGAETCNIIAHQQEDFFYFFAPTLTILLLVAGFIITLIPTVALAYTTGKRPTLRAAIMVFIYPSAAFALVAVIFPATFWAVGYLGLAIGSMIR